MLASVGTGHQNSPLLFYTCAHAHVCVVSEGEMEPHGVFREVTALCTNKDHYQPDLPNLARDPEFAIDRVWRCRLRDHL